MNVAADLGRPVDFYRLLLAAARWSSDERKNQDDQRQAAHASPHRFMRALFAHYPIVLATPRQQDCTQWEYRISNKEYRNPKSHSRPGLPFEVRHSLFDIRYSSSTLPREARRFSSCSTHSS